MSEQRITLRLHAVRRMFERDIAMEDVSRLVREGRTIESRPAETP